MKFQTNLNIHYRHVSVYNYTDKYAPALSEVVYRPLKVAVGCTFFLKKKKRNNNKAM